MELGIIILTLWFFVAIVTAVYCATLGLEAGEHLTLLGKIVVFTAILPLVILIYFAIAIKSLLFRSNK